MINIQGFNFKKYRNFVRLLRRGCYIVESAFDADLGFQTRVYESDLNETKGNEVYARFYDTNAEMMRGHNEICYCLADVIEV